MKRPLTLSTERLAKEGGAALKAVITGTTMNSNIYYHSASPAAKNIFFFPLCLGCFICGAEYKVERRSYDSFLLLHTKAGAGLVEHNGKLLHLRPGSLCVIDCYNPHKYHSLSSWEFSWIHFDGPLARPYFKLASPSGEPFANRSAPASVERILSQIIDPFSKGDRINEAQISRLITDLLTDGMLCGNEEEYTPDVIDDAIAYIAQNAPNPISLVKLADMASMSTFHFGRVFKKRTGFRPHEYIIRTRIDLAKVLLKTTHSRVRQIAHECGFGSEASFCTSFKKSTGQTPSSFRAE
jgi:AraC-like DNA-binding protein